MDATQDDTTTVETPTDYGTHSLNSDGVIGIYIGGVEKNTVVYLAQQLSLFLETEEVDPLHRVVDVLDGVKAGSVELAVGVEPIEETPSECHWPVEVEIEDADSETVDRIVSALENVDSDSIETVAELRGALESGVSDQPRSIVRLKQDGGGRRGTIEWHTDTDADKAETADAAN